MEQYEKGGELVEGAIKERDSGRALLVIFASLCTIAVVLVVILVTIKLSYSRDNEVGEPEAEIIETMGDSEDTMTLEEYTVQMNLNIQEAETNEEKSFLYLEKAIGFQSYLIDDKELAEKALVELYKAEELHPSDRTAWWIHYYENMAGDNEKAMEYLKKAKDRGYDEMDSAG